MNINHQRGSGSSVFLLIVVIIVAAVFFFKLFPLYMENMTVSSALEKVIETEKITDKSDRDIRRIFLKNLSKKDVKLFDQDTVRQHVNIERTRDGMTITVEYKQIKPLMKNVSFLVDFKNTVEIP
ncbi:DUF4845 domain-containing protein [Candidatus Halobeggiatoa sp. HSG11]|nr:DUF4845 domain-containing protein [Candidatus Halobeggiatoa sp. HSG11]